MRQKAPPPLLPGNEAPRPPARWESWGVDEALERDLVRTLRMKPGRTASGVATVTVLTKPWACASECLYCPNDVRMPKSYLADEPACQRAERAFFDPYLQVAARVRTLAQMGHVTDKVELIVLGGTWSDYPRDYQVWFAKELFRALNEAADPDLTERSVRKRQALYHEAGIENDRDLLVAATCATQRAGKRRRAFIQPGRARALRSGHPVGARFVLPAGGPAGA